MTAVGAIVLGQAPDRALERALGEVLGPEVEIVMRGPFDGATREELARLAPREPTDALTASLPDGTQAIVSHAEVARRAPRLVQGLREAGVGVTVLACTTAWPELEHLPDLVLPGRLALAVVTALLPPRGGRLGVCLPVPERIPHQVTPWLSDAWEVAVEGLPPASSDAEIQAAAARLRAKRPDLVVMDCMTYTRRTRDLVVEVCGAPALLPVSLAARVMLELAG